MRRSDSVGSVPDKEWSLDEITPDEQHTVEAIQRIAMALLDLPREQRAAQYPVIRKNFEAALTECGVVGPVADAWLDSTIIGIQALVMEIETCGGAMGGRA
jgi:hypothetical protein